MVTSASFLFHVVFLSALIQNASTAMSTDDNHHYTYEEQNRKVKIPRDWNPGKTQKKRKEGRRKNTYLLLVIWCKKHFLLLVGGVY